MKTLWALITIYHAIVSEAVAIKISNDVGISSTNSPSTNIKEDKVHHKRQLNSYFSDYPTYPLLDFPYGPINLGDGFDFYRSNFGPGFSGFEDLPPFEVGPLGPNGLYADVDHYANRFNYLPPPPPPLREGPTVPPLPRLPPTIPEPPINLNANPIIVDDGQNDVIKEIPPPDLSGDPGFIQINPNNGIPNNNNFQPPIYTKMPLNPYPSLPGSNDYLPPTNLNQFGYFPNYYGPDVLPNPFGLPHYQPPQRPDLIPVREPAAPEPFYIPPQLYRPAVSNPTPILSSSHNRTANTLVPTAPVSLGSGSLGIVRLNNGQFALGSGSLGYVGNLPYPTQSYLPQLPATSQPELYPGQRPQTFTIQHQQQPSNQGQQVQGQSTSQSGSSSSSSADNNQQRGVPQVIQTGTTRHRPFFGPVQLAPGPGPGGYGLGTDGRLGFLPTNLYQNLPSIQHLGEPEAINNNKYNLQPLQLQT